MDGCADATRTHWKDDNKPYVHYNHTIPSKHSLWTPWECFQYFYDRPLDETHDFYADTVSRNSSFWMLFAAEVILFWTKRMFRKGAKIAGWRVSWKTRGPEDGRGGLIRSSFHTMGLLSTVSRSFHPNFLRNGDGIFISSLSMIERLVRIHSIFLRGLRMATNVEEISNQFGNGNIICSATAEQHEHEHENSNTQRVIDISRVNQFLRLLEGKTLPYKMFARDTKASRNSVPPADCFMYHARAALSRFRSLDQKQRTVMCLELVANHFLRKMVRVLVATSIREASAGSDDDILTKLMDATCRRATAPSAIPDGLSLVDVGYTNFDRKYISIK